MESHSEAREQQSLELTDSTHDFPISGGKLQSRPIALEKFAPRSDALVLIKDSSKRIVHAGSLSDPFIFRFSLAHPLS